MVSPLLTVSERAVVLPTQDERLHEIVDGHYVELPPMSAYATWVASRLHGRLWAHTEEHALGTSVTEMLCVLDAERDLRRRPDVASVSVVRWPLDKALLETGDWGGAKPRGGSDQSQRRVQGRAGQATRVFPLRRAGGLDYLA